MRPTLNQYLLHVIKLIAMMIISIWQPEMKAIFLIKQNYNPVFKKIKKEILLKLMLFNLNLEKQLTQNDFCKSHTVFQSVTLYWPSQAWTILRWTWVASENDSKANNLLKSYFIAPSAFALLCAVSGSDDLVAHPWVSTSVLVHWKLLW